jgi:hypothetical protein
MRRPVFQIRVGSDAGCRVAGAGEYPICGPMDHNLQSGHECIGARQEHGGHARHYATRADSRQQLTRTTCAGAAGHHRPIIGNQRARALPASPLAPPLDTRSQSCTPKLSRGASGMASPKGRAVHVLGVAHGSACSSRVGRANHRRCFMLHLEQDTRTPPPPPHRRTMILAPPATQGTVPARTTHVKTTRPRCVLRHHRQSRRVLSPDRTCSIRKVEATEPPTPRKLLADYRIGLT